MEADKPNNVFNLAEYRLRKRGQDSHGNSEESGLKTWESHVLTEQKIDDELVEMILEKHGRTFFDTGGEQHIEMLRDLYVRVRRGARRLPLSDDDLKFVFDCLRICSNKPTLRRTMDLSTGQLSDLEEKKVLPEELARRVRAELHHFFMRHSEKA